MHIRSAVLWYNQYIIEESSAHVLAPIRRRAVAVPLTRPIRVGGGIWNSIRHIHPLRRRLESYLLLLFRVLIRAQGRRRWSAIAHARGRLRGRLGHRYCRVG